MTIQVIGLGDPARGDDGVGARVVEHLRRLAPVGLELDLLRGDPLDLLERWADAHTVVLVDAVRSEAPPGTLVRLEPTDRATDLALPAFVSSHALGLAETLALARALGRLPRRLVVYGIVAERFDLGEAPGEAVLGAVASAAAAILAEDRTDG